MAEQIASACGQVAGSTELAGGTARRVIPACELTSNGALVIKQDDSRICVPYGHGGTKTPRDEDGSYSVAPERLDIAAIDWGHTGMPYRLSVEFRPNAEDESKAANEKVAATARILGSKAAAHIADTIFGAGAWSWTAPTR